MVCSSSILSSFGSRFVCIIVFGGKLNLAQQIKTHHKEKHQRILVPLY